MKITPESSTLRGAIDSLHCLMNGLPGRSSTESEKARQGTRIRPCTPIVVYLVLWALERYPDLYPDLHHRAPALREHQAHADQWSVLERLGLGIAGFAHQNWLREQSHAGAESSEILDRIRLTAANPDLLPGVDHDLRLGWILPAFAALFRQRRSEVLARQRKATGAPEKPGRDPRAAARAQRRADANAGLAQSFRRIIPALSRK